MQLTIDDYLTRQAVINVHNHLNRSDVAGAEMELQELRRLHPRFHFVLIPGSEAFGVTFRGGEDGNPRSDMIPATLYAGAHWIVESFPDGRSYVHKNRVGPRGWVSGNREMRGVV